MTLAGDANFGENNDGKDERQAADHNVRSESDPDGEQALTIHGN
jgi:hypothetical protein